MSNRIVRLLLPVALFVLAACARADGPPSRPYWHSAMMHKAWTKRDGAPTGVFGIAQDANGMLWFAASEGVYRFDGVRFERLHGIDGNRLLSPNTNAILAVGSAIWVGYAFGGVSVFDRGAVRHYGASDGLSIRTVYKLAHTRNGTRTGTIWLSTSDGLYWLDGQRWRHVKPEDGLPPGNVHYFTDLPDGSILANHPSGVYRSDPGGHTFRKTAGGEDSEIHALMPNGDALLVDRARRFSRYDALNNVVTPLRFPAAVKVVDPFLDMRGALWVNTDAGLTLLDRAMQPLRTFDGLESLSGKQVFTTLDDRDGNLWLTTENGVDLIRETRLTNAALPPHMFRALSVQSDGDGTVWISNHKTDGDYDVATFGVRADGSRVPAPARNVTASMRAPDGSAWFANDQYLWHVDHGNWQATPLPDGLRGNDVQALALDAVGRLWVSIVHNGVHVLENGRWQAGGGIAALVKRTPVSLHADPQGRIWFGYVANRLAVLEHGALHEYGPGDGVGVGNISAMMSHAGRLWIGGDQGAAAWDGRRFNPVQDSDGQPLGSVAAMRVTARGELWMHGTDGLTRVKAAELAAGLRAGYRFHADRFDDLDGYEGKPSLIRPLAVLTEAADGRLWYASSVRVGWVDPARVARNMAAPAAQVTALRTDQRHYDALPGLVLPKYTSDLEVDFTAAVLGIPERARFRYRMVGQDPAWRAADTRRAAFYTNLGPGDYRFEVMAANDDGVWNAAPATFAFRIEPAFVQTIWFKLLCALLACALASCLYLRRMAQVTARVTERLRERQRERERIARALHDNFLQSVQALMMQFHLIKQFLPPDQPLHGKIDAALDYADEVLDEGREQVLALRLNHELTGDLEAALSGLGQLLSPRHDVRFTMQVQGKPRPLRAAAAAEAYAIGREALLNALRHAHSEEVTLVLAHAPSHFTLRVLDRGRGIGPDVCARGYLPGHFGLTGMRERAQDIGGTLDIHSEVGKGTTITLRIPARLAYARGKQATAASAPP